MSLFVILHKHIAETCPARDPKMGSMLLEHLSSANAKTFGVTIRGDAVVEGAHTLYVIAEAADEDSLNRYMQPFAQAGSVEIWPATTCEAVVERGGCDRP
jgi:hypothetical protein